MKKLSAKLVLSFTTFIVLLLLLASGAVYQFTKQQVEEDVKVQSQSLVKELKRNIDTYLEMYSRMVATSSENDVVVNFVKQANSQENKKDDNYFNWQTVEKEFQQFSEKYPDIALQYIGTKNKAMYAVPKTEFPADYDPTSRVWYKQAEAKPDEIIYTEPYKDAATGHMVVTIAKAVLEPQSKEVLGVTAIDLELDALQGIVSQAKVDYEGYAFLFDENGTALVHPTLAGKSLANESFIKDMYQSGKKSDFFQYRYDGEDKVLTYETIERTNWKVGNAFIYTKMLASAHQMLKIITIISSIAILLSVLLTFMIAKMITKPIIRLKDEVAKVAEGDLTVHIETKSKDEIGELTQLFNEMVTSTRQLIGTVQHSVQTVKVSVENLSAVSEEATASSEEIGRAIQEIASGATQQASDADTTNHKTMNLSSQIEQVIEKNTQINLLTNEAVVANEKGLKQIQTLRQQTNESSKMVESVQEVMKELAQKMNEIEYVIHTINDISDQTNLLALNASIEAARAGEHGKGFAVVADEVRKLAEQSSRATEQVRQTIANIQNEVSVARQEFNRTEELSKSQETAVTHTEQSFYDIANTIEQVVDSIKNVMGNMQEISSHKDEVVASIQSIAAIAQQSAAGTEEITASTEEQIRAISTVSESAEHLQELSEQLIVMVRKFKIENESNGE
ncbi:methyl-accepting chemotaxis protein [Priestia megaterium]|nr:methyl-accepting chemotaxis protein [Priestia megaterium]